jgi:hypothetical protein
MSSAPVFRLLVVSDKTPEIPLLENNCHWYKYAPDPVCGYRTDVDLDISFATVPKLDSFLGYLGYSGWG